MKADEVAKKALNGLKSGNFTVPCNFEGFFLSLATSGLSPQRSFLMAFIEVIAAGILRVVGLCFQWNWYDLWRRRLVPAYSNQLGRQTRICGLPSIARCGAFGRDEC
ncbi:hypothetical protein H5410_002201 [Solanum commersonii]|uniref:Uncharacterized protein n=1 Tax=Solanum commersonii TaxID=4109 RepID=A0A9J6B1E1_SOLCO|nr:hypothetical protein H5410_002201 [Solanum commersonii]